MDISRVVSDAGSLTVKIPVRGDSHKNETSSMRSSEDFSLDKVDVPQKQIAKIVRSAEELLQEKNSTETAPRDAQTPPKGLKIDEYV